jgi:hypothetical protein
VVIAAILVALVTLGAQLETSARPAAGASGTVSVDAATATGTVATQLSTQLVYPGFIESLVGAQGRLSSYAPPLVRIHAGTDGCCWAGGPGPALPGGTTKGNWDWGPLNQMVGNVRAYGGSPVLNVRYAPNWMWTCAAFSGAAGVIRDATFNEFGDYVARLVSYFNVGRMTTENGTVITNPAGTANRITYWELWNEPDLSNETPCHPADWGAALTSAQYLTMWNATTPKMLAVDPSIKLVGPATAGLTTQYISLLLASATRKPDALSFHTYGGWENTQSDLFLFDGDASCPECGIRGQLGTLADVKALAQGRPIWITELNVNAAYGNDPARRPWNGYGAAWGASAFRGMILGGAALLHQYEFIANSQFGLLNEDTGAPLLPYWRDYHLARAFPTGSTILGSSSTTSGIEVLAVRPPGSTNVRVLVINRQVPSATAVGAPGLPATVQVTIGGVTGVNSVTMRMLDDTTPLTSGPALVPLAASNSATVPFAGYGAAILEFSTTGGPTPNPTQPPGTTPPPVAVAPPAAISGVYGSRWVDQSAYPVLVPGSTQSVTVRFRNSGGTPWIRGVDGQQANLGIVDDDTSFDALGMNVGWLSANRVATTNESFVPAGGIGTFTFVVRAPLNPGAYQLPLQPVIDGVVWLDAEGVFVQVTSVFDFHSRWVSQSPYPQLAPGALSGPLTVTFLNTGSQSWVRGQRGQSNLGINGDDQRWASLGVDWPTTDRVAIQTEDVVAPGNLATFTFRVRAPQSPGVYYINLRPVIDGIMWMEDEGVWLALTVAN